MYSLGQAPNKRFESDAKQLCRLVPSALGRFGAAQRERYVANRRS